MGDSDKKIGQQKSSKWLRPWNFAHDLLLASMVSHDTTRTWKVPQHLQRPRPRFLNHQMLRSPIFRQKKLPKLGDPWRIFEFQYITMHRHHFTRGYGLHGGAPLPLCLENVCQTGLKKTTFGQQDKSKMLPAVGIFLGKSRDLGPYGTLQAEIRRLNATVGCLANQELRVSTSRWWFQQQLWICELHEVGVTLLRRPQPTVVMNISPRKKKNKKNRFKMMVSWW